MGDKELYKNNINVGWDVLTLGKAKYEFESEERYRIFQREIIREAMRRIDKYPYEKFPVYADFYINLDKNETIEYYTIVCVNRQDGVNSKNATIDSDSIDGTKVKIVLKDNNNVGDYKITVKTRTNNDNDYEIDIPVKVSNTRERTDRFSKQVSEEFVVTTDFSNDLGSSETISSITVSAIRLSDGSDLTSSVIEFSQKSSKKVLVGVQNGVDGELYRIVIKIQTSIGYKFQKNILMKVKEI